MRRLLAQFAGFQGLVVVFFFLSPEYQRLFQGKRKEKFTLVSSLPARALRCGELTLLSVFRGFLLLHNCKVWAEGG